MMEIEYEATFVNIDKDEIKAKLKNVGAHLERAEFLQKRAVFHLPTGHEIEGGWARVRDEGDKITMSVKIIDGDKITDQKEICLTIDNFNEGVNLLKTIGCEEKAYQETKRELWKMDGVEVTIDEWPFLEPLVEIEGKDERSVHSVAEKLGFDWSSARFCCSGTLFAEKYHFNEDVFNNQTPKLIFEMDNPFL